MKAFRALRTLSSISSNPNSLTACFRFYSAPDAASDESENDAVFDSSHLALPKGLASSHNPTWDDKYRHRVKKHIFQEQIQDKQAVQEQEKLKRDRANALLARTLLDVAITPNYDEDHDEIKEEDQNSLSVGIVGAPNAGKSALTNFMVGTKVSAVSRKINTTTHEVLGVMTKGDTQICFFDTPGLMLTKGGYPHKDMKVRVESVWSAVELYDVLIVIFDVHRHLTRTDSRVIRLIKRMGEQVHPSQKRVLCMNKVDLVVKKKDLLKVAEEFKDLPGYDRYFMISGLKGSGVKDLTQYLMEQEQTLIMQLSATAWRVFRKSHT